MQEEISSIVVDEKNQGSTDNPSWIVNIKEKVNNRKNSSQTKSLMNQNSTIYRRPINVRKEEDRNFVYTPRIVSFGPYHHNDESDNKINEFKELALLECLCNSANGIDDYVDAIREHVTELKGAYSELDQKWEDDDAFLKLMIYDGCFLLRILLVAEHSDAGNHPDDISLHLIAMYGINPDKLMEYYRHDILLMENQLPMQLLVKLLVLQDKPWVEHDEEMDEVNASQKLYNLLLCYVAPSVSLNVAENLWRQKGHHTHLHVLDLYRHSLLYHDLTKEKYSYERVLQRVIKQIEDGVFNGRGISEFGLWDFIKFFIFFVVFYIVAFIGAIAIEVVMLTVLIVICPLLAVRYYMFLLKVPVIDTYFIIPSATELDKVGIAFFKNNTKSFEDITVRGEILRLPQIHVDGATQSKFLNLIAFEQLHPDAKNGVTSYIYFMSRVIQSEDDVGLLQLRDIIRTSLRKAEVVELFKVLTKDINLHDPELLLIDKYRDVGKELTDIFSYRMNNLLERDLSQVYLKSPWTVISIVAALFLFGLTSVQTVYTVLGYINPK